jgi:Fe-S cluster biosynthesis and repair protein YggX
MPEADPNHIVHCIKLDKDAPGLKKPPFSNELGQYIYENISKEAWDHVAPGKRALHQHVPRRPVEPRGGMEFMMKQLRVWLGLEEGEMAQTAWTPPEK